MRLRIRWRLKAFSDFKNKQNVYKVMFLDIYKYVYYESVFNTLYIEIDFEFSLKRLKRLKLKRFLWTKINGMKNALFSLSRAPTHHSFSFNLRFLYELKHKVGLSKSLWGILHFLFRLVFIKAYIFVQQNAWTLWLWGVIISFKTKIIEKSRTVLFPDLWFLRCNKKF